MRALSGKSPGPVGAMRGVSLIELMVTIFVLAILTAVAVPSFRAVMSRSSVANAINSLSADMQFARGQAASQHRFVSLCRSTTGTSCQEAKSDPYNYDVGWIVYSYDVTSAGANQPFKNDGSMQLLRYTTGMTNVSVRGKDGLIFTFNQTGEFVTSAGRTTLSFVACPRKAGLPTTETGTNTTGIQGSLLTLRASGSIVVVPLPLTSSCYA
ncbi:type IV fimbrial biogenesis protein FimT [Luteibacter sp. UNC138MFCol5.1]|uniref:GspH/FimT family pseudopilin n=1 Tax=Luteibacter sp. UNC138MFCol5.1 TaxID=1502774 RepID=UPI0008BD6AF5|nr:GspH/FimT family pseudopilin [Luteibacter sp. UNC138MFCol5.1]SEO62731.1 type IV fimbrial biogenesis protein FimT [Luteibacter sp. UNC138MFCol5.1]